MTGRRLAALLVAAACAVGVGGCGEAGDRLGGTANSPASATSAPASSARTSSAPASSAPTSSAPTNSGSRRPSTAAQPDGLSDATLDEIERALATAEAALAAAERDLAGDPPR